MSERRARLARNQLSELDLSKKGSSPDILTLLPPLSALAAYTPTNEQLASRKAR